MPLRTRKEKQAGFHTEADKQETKKTAALAEARKTFEDLSNTLKEL